MGSFLYFIPGIHTARPEDIRRCGLEYALTAWDSAEVITNGPGDRPGCIVCESGHHERLGFFRAKQTWRKMIGSDVWIGMNNDQRPGPADLVRAKPIEGYYVHLLDGAKWLCPVARRLVEQEGELRWCHGLPTASELNDAGQWTQGDVLPRYAALWSLALEFYEFRKGIRAAEDGPTRLVLDAAGGFHAAAIQCLAANYRIGPMEAGMIQLLGAPETAAILDALIDTPMEIDWQKKKLQNLTAGSPMLAGQVAAILATPLPWSIA